MRPRSVGIVLAAVVLGIGNPSSAEAAGDTDVVTVAPGTVAFVLTTDDPMAQSCLARAGFQLQLVDVSDPAYATEVAGALDADLAVSLWQSTEPSDLDDTALAATAGQDMIDAARSVDYAAGGTVFLELHDAAPGSDPEVIQRWINTWFEIVQAAGYVAGLDVGPDPGLSAEQLETVLPEYFWRSVDDTPAIATGYSLTPAGPAATACGTVIDRYEVQSNAVGNTLTAVKRGFGASEPSPVSTAADPDDAVTGVTLTTGVPTSDDNPTSVINPTSDGESATGAPTSVTSPSSEPTPTTTQQAAAPTSRSDPTLPNTGAPIGPVGWLAAALIVIGSALAGLNRRRRNGHSPHC